MSQSSAVRSKEASTGALPIARVALAALVVAGLTLRLFLSRAPLWNDEIWSILNLQGVSGLPGILWGLSHDNNHFLNSIWLALVLPHSDEPTALRFLSIVAGVLLIPAMMRLGARHGRAVGLAAAALTAFSFFQVVYSVEARGYAVATLALVCAYSEIEAENGSRLRLAAASGLGFFAHLAFAPAIAGLAFATFLEARRTQGDVASAFAATFRKFWPAALACLPTLGFIAAGYWLKGGFTIGALTPFTTGHTIAGIVSFAMMTFGLDPTSYAQTVFALVGLPLLAIAAIVTIAPVERRAVYVVMLVLMPALALILHIPNTHVGRYFFASSPFLIALAADSFGALWRSGVIAARLLAGLALAAALISDGAALMRLERGETHPWTEALATIDASRDHALASSHDFNVGKSVAWYNQTTGASLALVPPERLCAGTPVWYVLETSGDGHADPALTLCGRNYRLDAVYGRDTPSQLPWALYQRAE